MYKVIVKSIKKKLGKLVAPRTKTLIELSSYTYKDEFEYNIKILLKEVINLPISKIPFWVAQHRKELRDLGPLVSLMGVTGFGTHAFYNPVTASSLLRELVNIPLLKVPFWIEQHKKDLDSILKTIGEK